MPYDISAGARLSATQKEMPRSRSTSEFNDELQSEDRYIQVIMLHITKCFTVECTG